MILNNFLIHSNAVNGMHDYNDDLSNEDDMESRNKFEEVMSGTKTCQFYNLKPLLIYRRAIKTFRHCHLIIGINSNSSIAH